MRLKITSAYRIRLFHLHTGCLRFLLTAIFLSCIKSYAYEAKLESIYYKNAEGLASFYPTQETEVSGVVYDELGTPLPGASVVIVGSKGGVITDFDGQFKIKLKPGDKLQISYVGLKTTIIEYSDQKNLEIHMEANMNALDDVTIVAFAKQKHSNRNTRDHTHKRTNTPSDPSTLRQPPDCRLSSAHPPPSSRPQPTDTARNPGHQLAH